MLTVLSILGVLAVLFVAAVVATREGPVLVDAPADIADLRLPDGPLRPEDLQDVRFGLAVRGYRMEEVDRVLDRLAAELTARDEHILELERSGTPPAPLAVPVEPPLASPPPRPEPTSATPPAPPLDVATPPPPPPPPPPPVEVAVVRIEKAPVPESTSIPAGDQDLAARD